MMLLAAGYPKEGGIDTVECMVAEGPRTESATGVTFGGIVSHSVAHAPGGGHGPLDEYSTYCVATTSMRSRAKAWRWACASRPTPTATSGSCDFGTRANQMTGTFEFVAGIGKYEDARISGQYRPAGPMFFSASGRLQRCLYVTGSYRLK
ncbi:MAG: hypothetical protein IPK20_21805 [Betaproteobacteria bacterium]|nr:hypothetical protein [Betaproteobacteria bacterium]